MIAPAAWPAGLPIPIATTLRDGAGADVSTLRARITKLADDFPLYEGLTQ